MSTDYPHPPMADDTDRNSALDHVRAWEALPWVVNGRATPEQAGWVARHVATCDDCRAELAWQQRLHQTLANAQASGAEQQQDHEAIDGDVPFSPDVEAGLQRLLARIDDGAEAVQAQPVPARPAGRLTWALAAAVVVQAIGLGVLGLRQAPETEPTYVTLSSVSAEPAPGAALRVLPDTTMTLAEWQALLGGLGWQVAAGPNAAGAYALSPGPGASAASRDDALARLRGLPHIRMAEPIAPTTP